MEMLVGIGWLAIIAIVLIAKLRAGPSLGERRYHDLRELASDLEERCGLEVEETAALYRSLDQVALSGKLPGGRHARIAFETEPSGKSEVVWTKLSVWSGSAPRLAVRRENLFDKVGKWMGVTRDLEVGDRAFDDSFLVQTSSDEKTLSAFAKGLKDDIRRLFEPYRVEEVSSTGGWLVAKLPAADLDPRFYPHVFAILDRAARSFDRAPIEVRVLGAERRAFVAEGATRCAYCHAGISGAEPDLVACPRCHTVLHDGCWSENGHCPVLGCAERTPERARTA